MTSTNQAYLSKEVCYRCFINKWGNNWTTNNKTDAETFFDSLWSKNTVFCLFSGDWDIFIYTTNPPPKNCPYILEHAVNRK